MNFSKQLKMYRETAGYSQEELAQKIYVTRQTISKWENDRSYPDIHNLIALSTLFTVTLDELVKGDVEMMKQNMDVTTMDKLSWVMLAFIILAALSAGPSVRLWNWYGLILPLIFWLVAMIAAVKMEQLKSKHDVKTYAEIVAFMDGGNIAGEREKRDQKKDLWNKIKIVAIFTLAAATLTLISSFLWQLLS